MNFEANYGMFPDTQRIWFKIQDIQDSRHQAWFYIYDCIYPKGRFFLSFSISKTVLSPLSIDDTPCVDGGRIHGLGAFGCISIAG